MLAHTLGNPFDLDAVHAALRGSTTCGSIEDNCDALGSRYRGRLDRDLRRPRHAELLPAAPHHHGRRRGAWSPNDAELKRLIELVPRLGPRLLVRRRRGQHLRQALRLAVRQLPYGYDHKYVY